MNFKIIYRSLLILLGILLAFWLLLAPDLENEQKSQAIPLPHTEKPIQSITSILAGAVKTSLRLPDVVF
jgi:hypothetical protein